MHNVIRPSNLKVLTIKCPQYPVGCSRTMLMFPFYWNCIVDEHNPNPYVCTTLEEPEKLCKQKVLSASLYEIVKATLSLAISLFRSCKDSKIYEVTMWVPAKLCNHYCSLNTLNSNFIVLIQEQWKAILQAQ